MGSLGLSNVLRTECCEENGQAFGQRLLLPGTIRQSEIIGALSTALDLTEGQPPGHAAKSCLIGMRLARQIGLPEEELRPLYFALLLKDLGCSSNASKMCYLFGADDRQVKKDVKTVDWTKAKNNFQFAFKNAAPSASPIQKAMQMVIMARAGNKGAKQLVKTRCERGADIAKLLSFPPETASAILSLDEHWNGKGHPVGLSGEEIPVASRIMGLAQTVEVFNSEYGTKRAVEVAKIRSGKWFDPNLVAALSSFEGDTQFWLSLKGNNYLGQLLASEPTDTIQFVGESEIDTIALAFARVVDAKSPWTFRHSEGVAKITVGISEAMGLPPEMVRDMERAALLHDIGKLGVSNMILDKPGRPTEAEFDEIRKHPDYSKQILDRISLFHNLSNVASAHHERLDGKGYHRQIPGQKLALESRILAVADVCEALSAKRPYRDAMPREKVVEIITGQLGTGLCPECFEGLQIWWGKNEVDSRVEKQLEALENVKSEIN